MEQLMNQIDIQEIVVGLIVLGAAFLVFKWFKSVMQSSKDEGKDIIKSMYKKRALLLEGLLAYMNATEAVVAASLASHAQSEISFPARIGVHGSISGMGTIFGFSMAAQWQEAASAWMTRSRIKDFLDKKDRSKLNRIVAKEIFDALFTSVGGIACPIITLVLIAQGTGETGILFNPFLWSEMSPLLTLSSWVVALHIPCVFYLGLISTDSIMEVSLDILENKAEEASKPSRVKWQNVVDYIKANTGVDIGQVRDYMDEDPTKRQTRKRDLYDKVRQAIELRKTVDNLDEDPKIAESAAKILEGIHSDLRIAFNKVTP